MNLRFQNFNRIFSKKCSMRSWRFCMVNAQMSEKAAKAQAKQRHCLVLAIAPPLHNRLTYFIFFSSSFSLTARPKSPSLNSMSALRKKLPTLMSRCITRWACRYEHAWTAWNIRYRTSGSVSLPRFLRVCTKDCIKQEKKTQVNSSSRTVRWLYAKRPGSTPHTSRCSRVV